MDLALQIFEQRGWQVVLVSGELDVATAPRLHEQLVTLASQGHRRIAIDLDGVTMFDWMGLGAVLGVLARVRALGGELVLISPAAVVRELLELTEIDGALSVYASLDAVPAASTR
jgi:anti-sigma B factor antagonist